MSVRIWTQTVTIPTYGVGEKNKNPMFFEKRVYQGSSGKVYPHPVIDRIEDEKKEQAYQMVFLENDYLQVQIMPELGGRIYRAIDKTNQYDFIYYNQVIKPALVGLTGPWISGGIEFNWPQHHRPNTFGPVEFQLDDSREDIKTVWLAERDRMYGTKVTTGISLRENTARIEITSELYNPTGEAQSFLWWANPAVAVHDDTQSIFPPDVHAVMDHGKRDVSRFPIATGTYYKKDYSAGVDISRYKNIPVPTSYMAYHSDYDFVGGYDWKKGAGILHVADHHISPGKKQWTWGCGEFGQAWDRNLTDEDGPYIELMTGMFTDNQPDFTWLAPYSGKRFTQYFMPYKQVGEVKNASKDIVVGLQVCDGAAQIRVYAARPLDGAHIRLTAGSDILLEDTADLSPVSCYHTRVPVSVPEHRLTLEVTAPDAEAVAYTPAEPKHERLPEPAKAIGAPETLRDTEALLLAGLHLEQYRHATFLPEDYYLEGLKRSPEDIRLNNAYGTLLLKRCQFAEALSHFEKARTTATRHNPNPYDGEAFFNEGKALECLGREEKAFDKYFKACWSDAWKTQGYTKLAQLAARRGKYQEAADFAQEALYTGAKNMKARAALTVLLRLLGKEDEAKTVALQTLQFDPMDLCALRELSATDNGTRLIAALRQDPHNHMTLAAVYAELGQYTDAVAVLEDYLSTASAPYAMVLYMRAYYLQKAGHSDATQAWRQAAAADPAYCFPNSIEEYQALCCAMKENPQDARAPYYLGCLLYDKRLHHEAARYWERAARLEPDYPTTWRNLSLYYANKQQRWSQAREALETAFRLDETDSRVFYELCELYRRIGLSPAEQRAVMEAHSELIGQRDDLSVGYAEVLNACGDYEQALTLLMERQFHPWEGGEGKVPTQHITARIGLARTLLRQGRPKEALAHLEKATVYYHNFGEGKLAGAQENSIYYIMGTAYQAMGDADQAMRCFEIASTGLSEPVSAMYYNDQPPHMIYYQGAALTALGREDEARSRFNKLVAFGETNLFTPQVMDYFAVSMPDFMVFETDLNDKNKTHCYYMMGLGYMGLGRLQEARAAFENALAITPNHYGVMEHLSLLQ